MKILLATSSVTPNAGIPSFNRELCRLLNVENEMHLLVDENIESYRAIAKVRKTAGKTKPVRANGRAGPGAGRAFAGTAQMPDTASRSGRILILSRIRPGIVKNGTNG